VSEVKARKKARGGKKAADKTENEERLRFNINNSCFL
jgi:hypothetical protein